jgi:hypothetical protein
MELIEDTQYALGLLNVNNERQLNSNNSITGAKLINGVEKTNSNEDYLVSIAKTLRYWPQVPTKSNPLPTT